MSRIVRMVPRGRIAKKMHKKRSIIFKVVGSACLIAAPILAVKGTIPSVRAVDKRKEELGVDKLDWKEIVKLSWKNYIPSVIATGGSMASFWYNDSVRSKETAAMAVAYTAAEKTLSEFKNEVKDKIGEVKAKEIETAVDNKIVQDEMVSPMRAIQYTGEGSVLFKEPYSNTYFYSSPNIVERAINLTLTAQLRRDDYCTVNDLLYILNLKGTDSGNMLGWTIDRTSEIKFEKGIGVWRDEACENCSYWKISYNVNPVPIV